MWVLCYMKWYLVAVAVVILGFVALALVVVPFFARETTSPVPERSMLNATTSLSQSPMDSPVTVSKEPTTTPSTTAADTTGVSSANGASKSAPVLVVGTGRVRVELARSPLEVERGLGGKDSLGPDEGMFFVFPAPDRYAFWMRDMRFSIDVVWFDERLRVVDVKEDTSPESYPDMFAPSAPARYVLEVSAGYVAAHRIGVGTQASFEGAVPEGVLP